MPTEVVLMMDLMGVLTSSPFPAARRLAENMMRCVFERAGAHLIHVVKDNRSVEFLARRYSNFFYTVIEFTEKAHGSKSAYERLELGEIHRREFIPAFTKEIDVMLQALVKENPEELEVLGIAFPKRVAALKRRFPLLADPIIQVLIRELCDAESFLCTVERVSPRKNVLNLLHYLRTVSRQEIRIFAMGNTWEVEGQYKRMLRAETTSVTDALSTAFPMSCPILYKGGGYQKAFNVNGLFDGNIPSYVRHKRKPYPDIFWEALEEVKAGRMPTGDALRYGIEPSVFYFDDQAAHCDVARNLHGTPFTDVFLIEEGAVDVYNDILKALKSVAAKDDFWKKVVEGVERDIAPLFKPPMDADGKATSWVVEEFSDFSKNLLFVPPPPCEWCTPVTQLGTERRLDEEDQDAILYYCAQHLPHLFPLRIPDRPTKGMQLWKQPGFATSSGPIQFEYVEGSKFFESYRISLRTGSYILRIQPRGPSPYGSADIRREFETMHHMSEVAPEAKVPRTLIYCDSYAVCGRRFFLRRYVDGEVIRRIDQLIQPRVQRPYSQRRKIVNVELRPKLFYRAAVDVLTALHNAPLPRFMKQEEEHLMRSGKQSHPLMNVIREATGMYRLAIETSKTCKVGSIHSTTFEKLSAALHACFDKTILTQQVIPPPERLVVVHGSFDIGSTLFSHRSLEGRAKYPPSLLSLTNFHFTQLGDPLMDVATLALFCYQSLPEGVFNAPRDVNMFFPKPGEILDYYCSTRGYMRYLDRVHREDIFRVYVAALCLQRAAMILTELVVVLRNCKDGLPKRENRNLAIADELCSRGMEALSRRIVSKM